MKKTDAQIDGNIRRLCRDINHVDDRKKLQTLVGKLQEVLRDEQNKTSTVRSSAPSDDPFDKIMFD
ncbi:MAG: hypothetical protein ACLQFM_13625 [Terriglobales bacterium]